MPLYSAVERVTPWRVMSLRLNVFRSFLKWTYLRICCWRFHWRVANKIKNYCLTDNSEGLHTMIRMSIVLLQDSEKFGKQNWKRDRSWCQQREGLDKQQYLLCEIKWFRQNNSLYFELEVSLFTKQRLNHLLIWLKTWDSKICLLITILPM